MMNVPGLARNCTEPDPAVVTIDVDAMPDPEIMNSNDPLPPDVFFMIVRRALSVVAALHSVEYVGRGQPIGAINTHLINGPMSEVPKPFAPPVIASVIERPRPSVLNPPVLELIAPFTISTIELPSPVVELVADVVLAVAPESNPRIVEKTSGTFTPAVVVALVETPPVTSAPRLKTVSRIPLISTFVAGVELAVSAYARGTIADDTNISTTAHIAKAIIAARIAYTM